MKKFIGATINQGRRAVKALKVFETTTTVPITSPKSQKQEQNCQEETSYNSFLHSQNLYIVKI